MNRCFQAVLADKQFAMRAYEEEAEWIYRGKLSLSPTQMIPFSVSISKGETYSFAQITYQKIAYIKNQGDLPDWYELINQLNRDQGIYYYFSLDANGNLFARYVTEVSKDWEYFFHILVQGTKLVKEVVLAVEERFGPFVTL